MTGIAETLRLQNADLLLESDDEADTHAGWDDIDLAPYLGGWRPDPPSICSIGNGKALFYPRRVNNAIGEPESGKSWLTAIAIAQVLGAGGRVLVLDYEADAGTLVERLLLLGVRADVIASRVHYRRPDTRIDQVRESVVDLAGRCELVVVDGVNEAMSTNGLNQNDNVDVALFYSRYTKPLADAGPAVVTVDHVTKSKDGRGKWAIGGGHKLAITSGTQVTVETIKAFSRTTSGKSKVVIGKDRTGYWTTGTVAAHLVVDVAGDVSTVTLEAAPDTRDADGHFRPTFQMGRISEFLASMPGECSTRQVHQMVYGKNDGTKTDALDQLAREGYVTRRVDGPGVYWSHIKRFTET